MRRSGFLIIIQPEWPLRGCCVGASFAIRGYLTTLIGTVKLSFFQFRTLRLVICTQDLKGGPAILLMLFFCAFSAWPLPILAGAIIDQLGLSVPLRNKAGGVNIIPDQVINNRVSPAL